MASKQIGTCDVYGPVPNVEEYQLTLTRMIPSGLLPEEPPLLVINTWKVHFGYRALARAMGLFERAVSPPRKRKEKGNDDQTAKSKIETDEEVAAEVETKVGSGAETKRRRSHGRA